MATGFDLERLLGEAAKDVASREKDNKVFPISISFEYSPKILQVVWIQASA